METTQQYFAEMENYLRLCRRIPRGEGCGTVRGTFACLRGCAEQVDLKNLTFKP